uniref:G-protein coupled receptors family 1 profile domain-containing protein n=1 Tax=Jaculus jaculus TaxID=51337 RepID=A0A8C5JVL6_JACJA
MEETNQSVVSKIIFQGLCTSNEIQVFLLLPFSILYLMTAVGSLSIALLIITDHHLHSPMYFLLVNLSLTTPKLTTDLLQDHKTISFGCFMTQILCVHFSGGGEMVLLVTMAYDRYVAICKPLHYSILISWIIGFVHAISQLLIILELPFYGPQEVDSFFCDIPLVLKLACINTDILGIVINADSGVSATTCFILLLVSYTYILLTVHLHSKDGSSKPLSTCTSHILVVLLFFGPCIFIYLWPVSITWDNKFLAVFYTVITLLLNPAIYTLRNKDIKHAIKKQINHL